MSSKSPAKTPVKRKAAAPATVTPGQMLMMAVEQGADLDKLERLLDLQERYEAREAEKAYVQAMSNFRADCPPIAKTRTGHNTRYAGLAETIDQIKDALAANGLSHSWLTEQEGPNITVTCTVTHADGHRERTSLTGQPDTSGSKNSIQAIGSTISYLERYTLFAALGLASSDMDTDGNVVGGLPESVVEALNTAPDVQALYTVYKEAYQSHPGCRKELTTIKDNRKKELADAG